MQSGSEAGAVQQQFDAFKRLAKSRDDEESWLVAKWDPEHLRVVFGCAKCIAAIEAKKVKLPCRYRDPAKSTSFLHCNVWTDVKRGIGFHKDSKTHGKVMAMGAGAAEGKGRRGKGWRDWGAGEREGRLRGKGCGRGGKES